MIKRKKRKRKSKLSGVKLVPVETQAEQRKKFPEELINAFVKVSSSDWEDNKSYKTYMKEAKKYLGGKIEDRIESGKLVVQLTKATIDLIKKDD